MNDDKTRPRLSLKRKAPSADTSVPASEAGADITVSRRKTVVVNTGPKRNKSRWRMTDRPPPGCPSRARATQKTKEKTTSTPTQQSGGGNTSSTEEKATPWPFGAADAPGGRRADAGYILAGSVHWRPAASAGHRGKGAALCRCRTPGTAVVEEGNTPLSENADADGNVSERPDGRSRMLQRGWLC